MGRDGTPNNPRRAWGRHSTRTHRGNNQLPRLPPFLPFSSSRGQNKISQIYPWPPTSAPAARKQPEHRIAPNSTPPPRPLPKSLSTATLFSNSSARPSRLHTTQAYLPLLWRLESGEVDHVERGARARHPPHEDDEQRGALPPEVEHEIARQRRLQRRLHRLLRGAQGKREDDERTMTINHKNR